MLGSVNGSMLVSLLVGSLPGIVLGSYLSARLPDVVLRGVLATVLALVGISWCSDPTGEINSAMSASTGPRRRPPNPQPKPCPPVGGCSAASSRPSAPRRWSGCPG